MIMTITYEKKSATDLGYILHKNPYRPQSFKLSFGKAYVFYPEISDERCTAALMLDINSVDLVRRRADSIFDYVNDRPYAVSSFLSVAISKVFGTALSGICKKRPDLVDERVNIKSRLIMVPCRGGKETIVNFFKPLGYKVETQEHQLDEKFPQWGKSKYYNLSLEGEVTIRDFLKHIYVIIPSLDIEKHYYVSEDEIEKLLRHGEGWLSDHPFREQITSRYLIRKKRLVNIALKRLIEDESDMEENVRSDIKESLDKIRLRSVVEVIKELGSKTVIDLGCGEGKLIKLLLNESSINKVAGMDVSYEVLNRAKERLKLDKMSEYRRDKLELFQGSLTYRDDRFKDYDTAAVIEVIEHMDENRLWTFEKVLFKYARPSKVIITTPNREYNENYGMNEDSLRHKDHRFEWSREAFKKWAERIADEYGYEVEFRDIGEQHEIHGSPTQMGVFRLCK